MPVVSNTSPILNLAIIEELTLLKDQFGEVLIPGAVLEELQVGEDLPGSQAVGDAMRPLHNHAKGFAEDLKITEKD